MGYFHCSAKIISRGSGRSAVAAAAYRAGEKLYSERDGLVHDYRAKGGVEHAEIMLAEGAPEAFANRGALWNAVEAVERHKSAQLAREIEIALPRALSAQERLELVRGYVAENFVSRGMCADFALHSGHKGPAPGQGREAAKSNPHAHILLTMRPIEGEGFGAKSKNSYALDENGERIKAKAGWKKIKEPTTDWDSRENIFLWREGLADRINSEMERLGLAERVDHRSYEAAGIEREPTVHLGPAASQMEARGAKTELGDINRGIEERNKAAEQLSEEIQKLEQEREAARALQEQELAQAQEAEEALRSGEGSEAAGPWPSAEEAYRQAAQAKGELVQLEIERQRAWQEQSSLMGKAWQAEGAARALEGQLKKAKDYGGLASRLSEERKALGFFAFRQKRALKAEIKSAEQNRDMAAAALGMPAEAALAMASQLRLEAGQLEGQVEAASPKASGLSERLDGARQAYIEAARAAAAHPEAEKIKGMLGAEWGEQAEGGLEARIAEARAERALMSAGIEIGGKGPEGQGASMGP